VDIGSFELVFRHEPPVILTPPQSKKLLAGATPTFTLEVSGYERLRYQWLKDGSAIPGALSRSLTLSNVTRNNSGIYSAVVSNCLGAVTSAPARLRVQYVNVLADGHYLGGDHYLFTNGVTISLQGAFSNGLIFYTLDGSQPTFESALYTGPFSLGRRATVRAIGYSASFLESGESEPVVISFLPTYSLAASTGGGGNVAVSPAQTVYLSNTAVTVTATPDPGWTFLGWQGDLAERASDAAGLVTMNRDKCVRALFGTTLQTTVAGAGSIALRPPGGLYPYGTIVELFAAPQSGSYFAYWGNTGSGTNNPLALAITSPGPTVSSLFGILGTNQVTLIVRPDGLGRVTMSPSANRYLKGTNVTVTATPDVDQSFLGWTGDATGAQNPLVVLLDQSKQITARFTKRPRFLLGPCNVSAGDEGSLLTLTGDWGVPYRIDASTNLTEWTPLVTLTNSIGTVQFNDRSTTNLAHRFYRAVEE
jgi:hypothetical protein